MRWPPEFDDSYIPPSGERYWSPVETMPPEERAGVILAKLKRQVEYAYERAPFYREKWDAAGFHPTALRTMDDLRRIPFITKEEIRRDQELHPPFGRFLCVEPHEVFRIHGTSGTTGKPTAFGICKSDWRRIAEAHARIMWSFGLRPGDSLFVGSFFSLYLGSWGALIGAERLGLTCFPFGAGVPGQTLRAVTWICDTQPTSFYGTPSYALYLAEVARGEGIDPRRDFNFRIMFFSGEPGAGVPATKRLIEETFGAECIDGGSMAEATPWLTNCECDHKTGMHLWEDIVYTEMVNPHTQEPVPPGGEGVPVYTHLERLSQPMIRLWSADLATWTDEPCPCGRTYRRLPRGIYGRQDDMIIVRGENIYPSAIEGALRAIEGFGEEFRAIITRERAMDKLKIQAEYSKAIAAAPQGKEEALRRLREQMELRLRATLGVRAEVELVPPGSFDRFEFKSRRIIDERTLGT